MAQNLARLVMKRGYEPFVVIRHENNASKSLYRKLGFEKKFEMARIVFTPFEFTEKDDGSAEEETGDNDSNKENGNYVNGKACHNGKVNNDN